MRVQEGAGTPSDGERSRKLRGKSRKAARWKRPGQRLLIRDSHPLRLLLICNEEGREERKGRMSSSAA
jgi:hypothetical protein